MIQKYLLVNIKQDIGGYLVRFTRSKNVLAQKMDEKRAKISNLGKKFLSKSIFHFYTIW